MYKVIFGDETGKAKREVEYAEYNAARLFFNEHKEKMPSDETMFLTNENGEMFDWEPVWLMHSDLKKEEPIPKDEVAVENKPTDTPNHYLEQGVETIDIIEEAIGEQGAINFIKGNVIKYLCRMDKKHKSPIDDAKKIKRYAEMLVERLEENKEV